MAILDPDRTPSQTLTTSEQGAAANIPAEFLVSSKLTTTQTTGIPVGDPYTPPDDANLIESRLVQDKTTERTTIYKNASYTGLLITSITTDPIFGLETETTKSIVPSIGGVYGVTVTAGGSGYDSSTTATSPAPIGGIAATYIVTVVAGVVTGITVLDPGSGHAIAPTITITGAGTGATAVALIPNYPAVDGSGNFIDITALDKWRSVMTTKTWSGIPLNQDTFNWDISFAEEDANYPIFTRRYLVRRDQYARLANGTAFTGVYAIKITAAGSGYTHPTVTVSDSGSGSGATAIAIVNPATGGIDRILVLTEGANYTTGTISVAIADSGGGTGTGATATATLQPVTCVLVKEDSVQQTEAWAPLYLLVVRIYKTLPGPARPSTSFDEDGNTVTETRTEKTSTTTQEQISGGVTWLQTSKEHVPGFSYYADELVRAITIPGVTVLESPLSVIDGVAVSINRQLKSVAAITPDVGESIVSSITWKKVTLRAHPNSSIVGLEITETHTIPGALLTDTEVREGCTVSIGRTLIQASTGVTSETAIGSTRVKKYVEKLPGSSQVALQVVETWTLPGTAIFDKPLSDLDGGNTSISRQLMLISSIGTLGESIVSTSTWQKVTQKAFEDSTIMAFKVAELHPALGQADLSDTRLDQDGAPRLIERELTSIAFYNAAQEVIVGIQYRKTYREHVPGSSVIGVGILETRDLPGPVLTKYEQDQATGSLVRVDRQMVDNSLPLPEWSIRSTTNQEPVDGTALISWNVTRTYGADLTDDLTAETRIDQSDGAVVTSVRQKVEVGTLVPGDSYSTFVWTRISKVNIFPDGGQRSLPQSYPVDLTTLKTEYLIETRALSGPLLAGEDVDPETGIAFPFTKQLVPTGTVAGGVTGAGVIHLTIVNPGSGFTSNPTITIAAPPSGTTATATATYAAPGVAGAIGSVVLVNGGIGYTTVPTATVSGGGGSGAVVTLALSPTNVIRFTVTNGGTGYTDVPTFLVSGGSGVGATGLITLTPTTVASAPIDTAGTGYTAATCVFDAPRDANGVLIVGGVAATGTVNLSGTTVSSISMTGNGSGYINRPTVTISGDGTGATAHSVLTGTSIAVAIVTGTGSGYVLPPTVAISGGGGSGGAITAELAPTTIASATLGSVGSGYSAPTVAVSGGGGSGAIVTAALVSGVLSTVTITVAGTGYLTAPAVTVTGGAGTGAVVMASIGSLTYIEVTPVNTVADMVMRTTVDLATLPVAREFPCTFRVQRSTVSAASVITISGPSNTSSGLIERTFGGGSGPVRATKSEQYMTDSQFAAYNAGTFSVTGKTFSGTLLAEEISTSGDTYYVTLRTFQLPTNTLGTTAGVLDLTDEKLKYGLRKVTTIYTTVQY